MRRLPLEPLVVPKGTRAISGEEVVFSIREVKSFSSLELLLGFSFCSFLRETNSLVRPICRLDCVMEDFVR